MLHSGIFAWGVLEDIKMYSKMKSSDQQRVELSKHMLTHLLKRVSGGMISELSSDMDI
jgi:hypothetical protein